MKFRLSLLFILFCHFTLAQKYKIDSGTISFFSEAPVENIDATNTNVSGLFDSATGEIAFLVQIKGFVFRKSLMQEHFNDKYMESDKFPKASFQGIVTGYKFNQQGTQPVNASGKLTIHGVTNSINTEGTLEIVDNNININSTFKVKLEDHKIKIPKLLWQNIAEEAEVKLDVILSQQ